MSIRYGLIGSGMMGQEHIRNLNLLEGCSVTAVADTDSSMRAKSLETARNSARGYSDYREMLAHEALDALVIVTPNDTHHSILQDVLATDLPILCEKPLCTTASDCRDVIGLAKGRLAPVWVAMEYRYMPPVARLLAEIEHGTVGTPRMIAIREHRFPFLAKVGDWNRFNSRSGGTLVEKCCHFWDLMRLAMGSDPVRVYASGGKDVNFQDKNQNGHQPDVLDNAFAVVDFENGSRGMLDLCMFAEGSYWQEVVSVTGEKARVDAKVPGPARFSPDSKERPSEVEISVRASKEVVVEQIEVDEAILQAGDHHGSTFFQHQRFRDLIKNGKGQPEVSLVDGYWSVLVGEAAEESVRTGAAVSLKG
ncbi:MAG: Gfo/Idh/MocA family oxidoreductase [Roseibium sp.]|nr:Gfo/Idh/MocA family oxidoreductase [Roseibium sp.]